MSEGDDYKADEPTIPLKGLADGLAEFDRGPFRGGFWPTDDSTTIVEKSYEGLETFQSTVGATLTLLAGLQAGRFFFVEKTGGIIGRGDDSAFNLSDPAISRKHAHLELIDGEFHVSDLGSRNGTFVDNVRVQKRFPLPSHCRIRLGSKNVLQFAALDEMGAKAAQRLSESLLVDPLTGTGNRYHLEERLHAEVSYARRHGTPLGVMLLDLDHFKLVNDTHGHLVGDCLLREIGRALVACVRAEDAVFRFGGEEFCILVRSLSDESLAVMGNRICKAINTTAVTTEFEPASVTASIGIAKLIHGEPDNQETLILRADQALFEAKSKGRNQLVMAESPTQKESE